VPAYLTRRGYVHLRRPHSRLHRGAHRRDRSRAVGLPDLGAHEWGWRTYLPLILKQYSTQ
ncbi:MAG: hypothetical protein Q7U96_03560, partial [Chloroflexota bacterium]|nr:hypothetical protein [Chloroflexota bacterium]